MQSESFREMTRFDPLADPAATVARTPYLRHAPGHSLQPRAIMLIRATSERHGAREEL